MPHLRGQGGTWPRPLYRLTEVLENVLSAMRPGTGCERDAFLLALRLPTRRRHGPARARRRRGHTAVEQSRAAGARAFAAPEGHAAGLDADAQQPVRRA